ncbi:MAG: ThiF family adenylyltransferase [Prevotellaceae bacterium]|nr:ThiF family adenylyltransferase [Prevotellaceae bacterium]
MKGYYVENTNCYNVLPFDDTANLNENKIYPIGFILPINPFRFVDKEIASQIQYLKLEEPATPNDIVSKIQQALQNHTEDKYFYGEDYRTEASNFCEIYAVTLDHELALNNDVDVKTKLKAALRFDRMKSWIKEVFIKGLYLHPDGKFVLQARWEYIIHERSAVVGYWEDDELHFVQLGSRRECKQDKYSLKLDVFSRNTGILESDIMLKKGAMFIGCGSVGSLFALELAKAGIGRFLLIDNDIFGYHNICRHQCGVYDVGRYKTDALKERILQVNPYAEVVTKNMTVQDVPVTELVEFCDKNTIVIGGADNREGDLYANNIAQQIEMPFMSIGCWERAFAGEIFYCLPSNMPNYRDFMEVSGLLSARVSQNRRFYTTEEELEKISFEPGISADINFVTIIAVKMALDILNTDNENYTQRLLPYLTQYTLVCNTNNKQIGGETAEIFSYPLQVTTSIIVPYSKQ